MNVHIYSRQAESGSLIDKIIGKVLGFQACTHSHSSKCFPGNRSLNPRYRIMPNGLHLID